ncbi:MAG: murein biosynthesis integral membrane protein MurJ [Thermaerobacter sp.]|nr:murein biosynthesis integral membrane protein MurJ [Thermaerobacter sp.]
MNRRAQTLRQATTIVALAMVLSRILGFFRSSVISALFGQGNLTDAYNAAFMVPDTFYMVLIGGGISSAFIPTLTRYIAEGNDDEGWRVTSIAFNFVALMMTVVLVLAFILAPWYMHLVEPGFGPAKLHLTVYLTRITLASIFFHSLNGVLIGTEYAYNEFWGTALGPLAYNLAIILIGMALASRFGIAAFAWSTLIGAAINFAVQVIGVLRLRPRYYLSLALRHPGIQRIFRLILPVMLGLSIAQINLLINQSFLASTLPKGTVNALFLASRIMLVPVMFAISVGITLLPGLSRHAVLNDRKAFRRTFSDSLRAVLFVTIPASVGLLLISHPLVQVLFQHGQFSEHATDVTAGALFWYTIGITGYAAYEIISRGFYALEDTRTPVIIGASSLVAGVAMNFIFVHLFRGPHGTGGANGLAFAYSLTGILNAGLLLRALRRRAGPLQGRRILKTSLAALISSLGMAFFILGVEQIMPHLLFGPHLFRYLLMLLWPILVGAVSYAVIAHLLGAEEVAWIMSMLRRRLSRA